MSASKNQKTGGFQQRAAVAPVAREPHLSAAEGAGAVLRFHRDWALTCAKEKSYAVFVTLFEDNVMPTARAIAINPEDLGEMPEALQAQMIAHASKKYIDAVASLQTLTEEVYNRYWMSLSEDWQQKLASREGFAAIKAVFNLAGLKNMLEAAFSNPDGAPEAGSTEIDTAQKAYFACAQTDRETLAQYYKRFMQVLRQLLAITPEAQAPTEETRVVRFLSSLNARDSVYYTRLKEQKAISGGLEVGNPVSVEDALVKGARFLLQHYGGGRHSAGVPHAPSTVAATVYTAEARAAPKPRKFTPGPVGTGAGPRKDMSEVQCYGCKQFGHYRSKCPAKELRSMAVCACDQEDETETAGESAAAEEPAESDVEHDAVCYSVATTVRVKGDSCAEVSLVGKGFPVEDLQECDPLVLKGVGGTMVVTQVGKFGPLQRVYYSPDIDVHILSFGDLENVADVSYTQGKGFDVHLHGPGRVLRFRKWRNTYVCDLPVGSVLMTTVAERERTYTKAEVMRAREARELKRNLAGASDRDLIEFITNGVSLNCPLTPQDVRRAEAIYGPDIACLKGKMTSPGPERPLVVRVDHGEQRRQDLYTDVFEVYGVHFLLTMMLPMRYTFVTHLPGKTVEEMTGAVTNLFGLIQSRGFEIGKLVVDPEGGLLALAGTLAVNVDPVAPGTHVAIAERRGRTVKERMRTVISGLNFRLAARFVPYLVSFVVTRLNLIPHAADGSRACPRERFTGQKIVFTRDLQLGFGDCAEVFANPAQLNSMEERSFSAMALYPSNNDQGSWKFFKFRSGTVVTGSKWTKTHMGATEMKILNDLADEDAVAIGQGKRAKMSMTRVRTAPGEVPLERMIVSARYPTLNVEPMDGTVLAQIVPAVAAQPEVPPSVPDEPQPELPEAVEAEEDEPVPDLVGDSDDEGEAEPAGEARGSVWSDGTRTSARQAARAAARETEVYKLSVAQAVEKYGQRAEEATLDEFMQMKAKAVMKPVRSSDLSPAQRERVIHSSLFLKEKYTESGEIERLKARLVASGNEMDRDLYSPGSSPTVATEAMMIILAQSAAFGEVRCFVDIGTAFLEASIKDEEVYMLIGKSLVPYLLLAMPEAAEFVDHKGRVLVKLLKALYGCIQSSRLWYEHIRDILVRGGFRVNDYDSCVFHKGPVGQQCTVCLHVDDLLITASTKELVDDLLDLLRVHLHEVKVKDGKVNMYLGMRITDADGHLEVDMNAYASECVEWSGVEGTARTPADAELFEQSEGGVALTQPAKDRFHTGTAKLLYLGKRCGPSILTAVSYLCSRVQNATEEDARKLARVFKYLRFQPAQVIRFAKNSNELRLFAYVDAGYGVHSTGESRSGLVVTVNDTPVLCKTMRQRIVTKSSTEAELVALSDGLTEILWARQFVESIGHVLPPTPVGEDNTSVLKMLKERKFGTARTKHISVRYFFVCDYVARGEVEMVSVPTEDQLADILSKALVGRPFQVLSGRLHGADNA